MNPILQKVRKLLVSKEDPTASEDAAAISQTPADEAATCTEPLARVSLPFQGC